MNGVSVGVDDVAFAFAILPLLLSWNFIWDEEWIKINEIFNCTLISLNLSLKN